MQTSPIQISVSDNFKNQEVISMKLFDDFFNFVKIGKPKPVKNLVIPIDTVSIAICLNNDIKSSIIIGKEVSANMCKKILTNEAR